MQLMQSLTVSLTGLAEPASIEAEWLELQARAAPSFFQSWTWVGLVAARFDNPVLMRAVEGGRTLALALLNRRRRAVETLWLGESGVSGLDDVFVEHNGILIDPTARAGMLPACLSALLCQTLPGPRATLGRRVVLSGVDAATLDGFAASDAEPRGADPALVVVARASAAPRVEFADLAGEYIDSLSANTRYQIRRSDRHYAAKGPLRLEPANSLAQAQSYLDALSTLHQRAWQRRGRAGAFANPAFTAFHRALLERGVQRGEIDVLQISAGSQALGYLYNFIQSGRVVTYQSGFDYDGQASATHARPGLTSHRMAIEHYRRAGLRSYDFLAGDARYKQTLSNAETRLFWLTAMRRSSWPAQVHQAEMMARNAVHRLRKRLGALTGQ